MSQVAMRQRRGLIPPLGIVEESKKNTIQRMELALLALVKLVQYFLLAVDELLQLRGQFAGARHRRLRVARHGNMLVLGHSSSYLEL